MQGFFCKCFLPFFLIPPRYLTCAIFRAVFDDRSLFFAPKPHRNACYAGYRILHHHDLLPPLYSSSSSSSSGSFSSSFFPCFLIFFSLTFLKSIWFYFFPTPTDKQSILTKVRARSFKAWYHLHSNCHTSLVCVLTFLIYFPITFFTSGCLELVGVKRCNLR